VGNDLSHTGNTTRSRGQASRAHHHNCVARPGTRTVTPTPCNRSPDSGIHGRNTLWGSRSRPVVSTCASSGSGFVLVDQSSDDRSLASSMDSSTSTTMQLDVQR
jgi:hypothetical protein